MLLSLFSSPFAWLYLQKMVTRSFFFQACLFFPRQAISSMRLDDPERLIDFISGLVQVLSAVMKEGNVFVFVNCVLVSCQGRRGILYFISVANLGCSCCLQFRG